MIINELTRDTNKPLINKLAAAHSSASEPVRVVGPLVCVVLLFNVLSYWKSKRGRLSGIDQTCVLGHGGLVKAVIIVPPMAPGCVCIGRCL